jgi:hypothetical protein
VFLTFGGGPAVDAEDAEPAADVGRAAHGELEEAQPQAESPKWEQARSQPHEAGPPCVKIFDLQPRQERRKGYPQEGPA